MTDGRRFRALTVIDLFTHECLAIDAGHGLSGQDVAMDLWASTSRVILDFSRRGKPTHNATIESFNGRFRDVCLNVPSCLRAFVPSCLRGVVFVVLSSWLPDECPQRRELFADLCLRRVRHGPER
jgi:transposase InsO family protein